MRRSFVSLATDALPTYAAIAPVTAKVWRTLGYTAIVAYHDTGWDYPLGRLVLSRLSDLGATLVPYCTCSPLSVANTMRCARLVAAHVPTLGPNDFILTADVDMFPLNRTYFDRHEDIVTMRALGDLWVQATPKPPKPPRDTMNGMRFSMCYTGATVENWRTMLPITIGSPNTSLRSSVEAYILPPTPNDGSNVDLDERVLSLVLHRHPSATGHTIQEVSVGVWRQGGVWMLDPVDAPNFTPHEHISRGVIIHSYPGNPPPGAIDYIVPRFYEDRPWWAFDMAKHYFPEDAGWIDTYIEEAKLCLT